MNLGLNLFSFLKRQPSSAPVARERLQIVLAHERGMTSGKSDLVALLKEEILAVVAKHIDIERDNVQIKVDRGDALSMLAIDIQIPGPLQPKAAAATSAVGASASSRA